MSTNVVLLGAGGYAREVLLVFEACNREAPGTWDMLGFVSEVPEDHDKVLSGLPVLGGFDYFDRAPDGVHVIGAVGGTALRKRLVAKAVENGLPFASVIHPTAVLPPGETVGQGTIVSAGVIFTSNLTIGEHCVINLGCTVGHDAVLNDFVTLAPGVHVSGNVRVGTGTDVGSGAVIIQRVSIGSWSIVGAGAVVSADLDDNVTAVGVPARVIKERQEGWWRGT